MKQPPFKFQSNNSKQAQKAKSNAPSDLDAKKGNLTPSPKNLKATQSRSKSAPQIRTGRSGTAQRPKGNG